jgi:hypothetical protein
VGVGGLSIVMVAVMMVVFFAAGSSLLASGEQPTLIAPPDTTTPNQSTLDGPRIRIDSPGNQAVVDLDEDVIIQVVAFDREGVTRIELLRYDVPIQQISSTQEGGESPFEVELIYHPDEIGRHQLKLVAYRGNLAGDSRFLTLEVR